MQIEISELPFDRVRDQLAFYTTESSRAYVTLAQHKAHRRYLLRQMADRKNKVINKLSQRVPKWRAVSKSEADKRVLRFQDELTTTDNIIEILERLGDMYRGYADALSREITARKDDRDRWYGRAGSGK